MKNLKMPITALFFTFFSAKAHLANPIKWQCKIEKKSSIEFLLTFEGTIEKDWHLYSQFTPKGGPAPLEILFSESIGKYKVVGKGMESKTETKYNEFFGVNETFFTEKVKIQQTIMVWNKLRSPITVELMYQICKNVCIPQKMFFEFDTNALTAKEVDKK